MTMQAPVSIFSLQFLCTYGAFSHPCLPSRKGLVGLSFISQFHSICFSLPALIVYRSSGMLKSGEMCLVLGCPGAGCTTFLKAMTNDRETFASVTGEVLYEGIDAETMKKYYKGEVVYNQEGESSILVAQ
jgi:hypothetical protein